MEGKDRLLYSMRIMLKAFGNRKSQVMIDPKEWKQKALSKVSGLTDILNKYLQIFSSVYFSTYTRVNYGEFPVRRWFGKAWITCHSNAKYNSGTILLCSKHLQTAPQISRSGGWNAFKLKVSTYCVANKITHLLKRMWNFASNFYFQCQSYCRIGLPSTQPKFE